MISCSHWGMFEGEDETVGEPFVKIFVGSTATALKVKAELDAEIDRAYEYWRGQSWDVAQW